MENKLGAENWCSKALEGAAGSETSELIKYPP